MEKIDYKQKLKPLYNVSTKRVEIVNVPKMNFLMIDGQGDPNKSQSFQEAIAALFALSYTLKFMAKKSELAIDYSVMPLEGIWWADDMSTFSVEAKDDWKWTLMIMQPDIITQSMVNEAIAEVRKKKHPTALPLVRFESFNEGKSAQMLHIGPFSEEGSTIEKVHAFVKQNSSNMAGKHHEIYLSDIRRAAPEKWKTIIRQPIS